MLATEQVNWALTLVALVVAVASLGLGILVFRDWRGIGTWMFKLTIAMPLGGLFYKKGGARSFCQVIGVSYGLFGFTVMLIVAVVMVSAV